MAFVAIGLVASTSFGAFVNSETNSLTNECDKYDRQGYLALYNGDSTWSEAHMWNSLKTGHGTKGRWWTAPDPVNVTAGKVPEGQNVLWSNQTDGMGSVLMSKRKYTNYEAIVSAFPGWNNDGGFFHRTTATGVAFQMMIDYRAGDGNVGGYYPEGGSGGATQRVYTMSSEKTVVKADGGQFMNWLPAQWYKTGDVANSIWDPDGFNTIKCKMTGPVSGAGNTKLDCWLRDTAVVTHKTDLPVRASGFIALQIHAGAGAWQGGPNKYLWLKVRELDSLTGTTPVCPANPAIAAYGVDYKAAVNGTVKCTELVSGTCTGAIQALKLDPINLISKNSNSLSVKWQDNNVGQTLRVTGTVTGEYTISLMNISGQQINSTKGTGAFSHDFSGLTKGIYLVSLMTKEGMQTVKAARF